MRFRDFHPYHMGGGSINTIIAQWFNHRRGLAASLALNGATCGGLLFAPAFAWAIDTHGLRQGHRLPSPFVLATLWPLASSRCARRDSRMRPTHGDESDARSWMPHGRL